MTIIKKILLSKFWCAQSALLLVCLQLHAQTTLKSSSLSNGAATIQGATYKLKATVGQTLTGNASSASFNLAVGFDAGSSAAIVKLPDLQLTTADINPTTIAPGTETAVTFSFKNAGDATATGDLVVKAYLSINTELDGSDLELASFTVTNSLAVNATYSYPGSGQSNKILVPSSTAVGSYQIILSADPGNLIPEKNETNNVKSIALAVSNVTTGGPDTSPPAISITSGNTFAPGVKITIAATDNIGVTKVILYHRGILSPTFSDSVEVTPVAGNYSFTVEESWLDIMGVEFYGKAYDAANNKKISDPRGFIYKGFDAAASPVIPTLGVGSYAMFSVPYVLEDNNIRTIFSEFGDIDKKKWRLLRYENGKNVNYSEPFTKIERGKGYWFNGKAEKTVRIGEGAVPPNNQSSSFQLSLAKGWNQIGNPYPFNVDWSDVLAVPANSFADGKVDEFTLEFNQNNFVESDILRTWGGAFVHADENITLSLPVTLKNTASRKNQKNEFANKAIDTDTWAVPLSIEQGTTENSYGGFGMHPEANTSKDRYDKLTVPRFIHYLELNSYHPEFFDPWFSRDIVLSMDHYTWNFSIETDNPEEDIKLSWDNNAFGNNNAVLLLYDPLAQVLINMKQSTTYHIGKTNRRDVKIFFGRDEKSLNTDVTGLGQIYPNPVIDQATIPFLTSGNNERVEITLFDMMGKRVRGLVNGYFNSGYHEASWDGKDAQDAHLPAGVYFYRMDVNGRSAGQAKRFIIR
jgi:hypothetical protein